MILSVEQQPPIPSFFIHTFQLIEQFPHVNGALRQSRSPRRFGFLQLKMPPLRVNHITSHINKDEKNKREG